jgi:hypothetical protein
VDADDDDLVLQWMSAEDEAEGDTLRVPRTLLDQIDANPAWEGLREQLQGHAWVDLNRLLVTDHPKPPAPRAAADDATTTWTSTSWPRTRKRKRPRKRTTARAWRRGSRRIVDTAASDFSLRRDLERVVHLDAEASHRTFKSMYFSP